ncbi:MAG: hypothetical protein QM770_18625 [Tepidisphaeraceae bacterium]
MQAVFSRLSVIAVVAIVLLTSAFARAQASLPPLAQSTLGMRVGQRLAYLQASALVGATGMNLVPDANGNWVDVRTGKPYAEGTGTGGAGISTFDVYAFDSQAILLRNDYLINTAINRITWTNSGVIVGSPTSAIDILWAPPANFAKQPNVNVKDLRVTRLAYTLDGRKFSAIRIQANVGNSGWVQSTYDLQTGLLLIQSRAVQMPTGGTAIAIMRLVSGRPVSLPGMGVSFPASNASLTSYTWKASGASTVSSAGTIPTNATVAWTNLKWTPRILSLAVMINGKASGSLQYVAGTVGSPWMSPSYLASLKANTIIDVEPQLQYRMIAGAPTNGLIVIYVQNSTGYTAYQYQIATGHLVAIGTVSQQGLLTTQGSLVLTGRK